MEIKCRLTDNSGNLLTILNNAQVFLNISVVDYQGNAYSKVVPMGYDPSIRFWVYGDSQNVALGYEHGGALRG
jgi:hypothetical protein